MSHVPNDADDLAHLRFLVANAPTRLDAFADDILPRKEFLGETLIHDYDRKRVKFVRFLKHSALQERDAHCLEIIRTGETHRSIVAAPFRQGVLLDIEISRYIASSQRQRRDDAGGIDSWDRSDFRK